MRRQYVVRSWPVTPRAVGAERAAVDVRVAARRTLASTANRTAVPVALGKSSGDRLVAGDARGRRVLPDEERRRRATCSMRVRRHLERRRLRGTSRSDRRPDRDARRRGRRGTPWPTPFSRTAVPASGRERRRFPACDTAAHATVACAPGRAGTRSSCRARSSATANFGVCDRVARLALRALLAEMHVLVAASRRSSSRALKLTAERPVTPGPHRPASGGAGTWHLSQATGACWPAKNSGTARWCVKVATLNVARRVTRLAGGAELGLVDVGVAARARGLQAAEVRDAVRRPRGRAARDTVVWHFTQARPVVLAGQRETSSASDRTAPCRSPISE